jgi:hypothetical protein
MLAIPWPEGTIRPFLLLRTGAPGMRRVATPGVDRAMMTSPLMVALSRLAIVSYLASLGSQPVAKQPPASTTIARRWSSTTVSPTIVGR